MEFFYFWFVAIPLRGLKIYLKQHTEAKALNFESKHEYQILKWTKSLSLVSYILEQKYNTWYVLYIVYVCEYMMWYVGVHYFVLH